jgi:homoserine O-acetyltransferase/O-succinyltransferase
MSLTTFCASIATTALLFATPAFAADAPQPRPGDWTVKDFRFHTGEVLPELKLHYVTIGEPVGEPVLVLHGSNGSGQTMLGTNFAGELFAPGQPLDAAKYFLIVTDALGSGKSSKPSNGLRMAFPKFTYEDQVRVQYRLLTEHLGVKHLKLIIGQSMGGMHAWMWGEMYPDFMDVLVPMGSQPVAMSGRNWVLRRTLIDAIKADPAWNNGNYTEEPPTFKYVATFFSLLRRAAPSRSSAGRQRVHWPTSSSSGGSRKILPPMPTITSTPMRRRVTMIHRRDSGPSRRACWRSMRPTMSVTRSNSESSRARSSA